MLIGQALRGLFLLSKIIVGQLHCNRPLFVFEFHCVCLIHILTFGNDKLDPTILVLINPFLLPVFLLL
ncbi:hypothetical protein ACOSP7_032983 [Xanthoceras sorbifolium]